MFALERKKKRWQIVFESSYETCVQVEPKELLRKYNHCDIIKNMLSFVIDNECLFFFFKKAMKKYDEENET